MNRLPLLLLAVLLACPAQADPPTTGGTGLGQGIVNGVNNLGGSNQNPDETTTEPPMTPEQIETMMRESAAVDKLLNDVKTAKNLKPEQVDAMISRIQINMTELSDKKVLAYFNREVGVYLDKLTAARASGQVYNPSGQDHRTPVTDALGNGLPNRLITVDPANPDGWARRGSNENLKQNWQGGYEDLSEAIRLGAHDANTYASYAAAAYNLGDTELAARAAAKALELDPTHAGALALLKLSQGHAPTTKLPSALGAGDALGQGGPKDRPDLSGPEGAPERGETGEQGGGGEQAGPRLTAEQIAAEIQRQSSAGASPVQKSAGLTRSAGSSLAVKDYSAAKSLASKAIEFNEQNAQAYTYRAIANNKLHQYGESVSDASSALRYAPSSAAALQTRSNSLSRLQRFNEGLADANRTLEQQPRNGQAYFNRAFALAGLGERAEAVESLKKAAEVDARFRPRYEEAVQAPQDSDLLFLFDDKPTTVVISGAPASPAARKRRFLRLMLTTIMGGVLVALGLLHILSAGWREKVRATIRRVLSESPEAGAAAKAASGTDTQSSRPPASGFWGQYTLSREIGSGGMGIVYEAQDNSLDRRVAVKKMRDEIRVDPQERRRFITEARTVASLHHPNIVDIYAIVEEDSDVYLVFEYVDGLTLSDLIRDKGPLAYDEAAKIFKSVCAAVECAHRQNVIHRDLKPSNIMVTGEGHVKVMDFGVARQAKDAMTKMSMTNTIVGTPPYMAPEQEQGTVRKESDVFALGICFYELLTGKLPFSGQGAGMLLNKINGKHVPPSTVRSGLPPQLDEVLARALCADPDKRYRTPAELMTAVEAVSTYRSPI